MKKFIAVSRKILPASFAIVMATGIVSIAAQFWGLTILAHLFLFVNGAFFVSLCALWISRIFFYRSEVFADFDLPRKAPGFLTWVAGTNVLANQFLIVGQHVMVFKVLAIIGITLWVLIVYGFMFRAITSESKNEGEFPVSGVWLLLTVATQSTSVALVNYSQFVAPVSGVFLWFVGLMLFLLGIVFYVIILSHVVLKLLFSPVKSADMVAPNWIILGAAAISTMAGALLIQNFFPDQSYTDVRILKTLTLALWSTATWWGPLLISFGVWKHFIKKDSFRYEPQMWSLVFPLGMYAAATFKFAHVMEQHWMVHLSMLVLPVALLAWTWVFVKAVGVWVNLYKSL